MFTAAILLLSMLVGQAAAADPLAEARRLYNQAQYEQAEKLALASSEGRLQLVMRNSIDQGDEVTNGATKKDLLSGERAQPVAEPGLGSDKPTPRTPRRARPRPAAAQTTAAKVNTPAPAPVRPSIEVIEGSKKKNVDFP